MRNSPSGVSDYPPDRLKSIFQPVNYFGNKFSQMGTCCLCIITVKYCCLFCNTTDSYNKTQIWSYWYEWVSSKGDQWLALAVKAWLGDPIFSLLEYRTHCWGHQQLSLIVWSVRNLRVSGSNPAAAATWSTSLWASSLYNGTAYLSKRLCFGTHAKEWEKFSTCTGRGQKPAQTSPFPAHRWTLAGFE